MGHYYSEMHSDVRTQEQIEEDKKEADRRDELTKRLCKVLKCKEDELRIVFDILKDNI